MITQLIKWLLKNVLTLRQSFQACSKSRWLVGCYVLIYWIRLDPNWWCLEQTKVISPWWRHEMETFSALLALCAGNSPFTGEFPSQRPVMRSFDVFFDLCLNKRLSKQSRRRWFETPWCSLWRHCNMGLSWIWGYCNSPDLFTLRCIFVYKPTVCEDICSFRATEHSPCDLEPVQLLAFAFLNLISIRICGKI